jgi:hypothetical protein
MTRPTQKSRTRRCLAGIAALAILAAATIPMVSVTASTPNAVLTWNLYAVQSLSNTAAQNPPGAGQSPPVASIHLAMVQGAVYDAVIAFDRGYQPYIGGLPTPVSGASMDAAVAAAARGVLIGLPPLSSTVKASVESLYSAYVAGIAEPARTQGAAIGAAAAAAMLADRADDHRYEPYSFTAGSGAGAWRPDLPSFGSDPFAWVSNVRPFTMTSTSQFRTAGPYPVNSPEYTAEFNEVKTLGGAVGTPGLTRTAAQTALGLFYSVNPLPMLNAGLRTVAETRGLSLSATARLFGMTSLAGADALIGCWDDKDHWNFWRPITAIRAADDGNPDTAQLGTWLPLLPTPPYPDHPSGYNCFTGATMQTAAIYFRSERISISLTSSGTGTATTRTYKRFTAVLKDTIDARIYLGFHFRNPDVQGAWLGKKVAQWSARHYFQPIR